MIRTHSSSRRLLLLSTDMGMGGGAEEQVIHIAYAFKARGWEVRVVSMLPPSPMPADFLSHGIPLDHLGMRRGIPSLSGLFRLRQILREFRPRIVHAHMAHANILARAARLIQPYPALICTLHALTMAGVDRDYSGVFEFAHRVSDRLAERTTAICGAAAEYYVRKCAVPARKMIVVHNGIDTRRYARNLSARERLRKELDLGDKFTWLAVGRLEPVKAYAVLLRAFARLAQDQRALLICGQGSQKEALQALAAELSISDSVKFLGLRVDVPDVMSAADAFAMSSDSEGLPLVLLQASAAALPVVATDVGGNSEAVPHGVSGLIVPAGDPVVFSAAMSRVEAMPAAERAMLGRAGQGRVREMFEAERVFDRWEQMYLELPGG